MSYFLLESADDVAADNAYIVCQLQDFIIAGLILAKELIGGGDLRKFRLATLNLIRVEL